MPGSAASSAYQGLYSVNGPNFAVLERSQYVTPDKVSANLSYYIDLIGGLQVDLYYTGYSPAGNSFTYSNDMNGDGLSYDLIYIPATKDEVAFTSEADRDAFWKFVEQDNYLSKHKGQYAESNAARAPFVHRFDRQHDQQQVGCPPVRLQPVRRQLSERQLHQPAQVRRPERQRCSAVLLQQGGWQLSDQDLHELLQEYRRVLAGPARSEVLLQLI